MAEEGTPPAAATWDPGQVAAWVLTLDIPGKETIAQAVTDEELDGDALLGFKDQIQVKAGLGIPMGKANKLWAAISELRAASAGPHSAGTSFAMLPRSTGTEPLLRNLHSFALRNARTCAGRRPHCTITQCLLPTCTYPPPGVCPSPFGE